MKKAFWPVQVYKDNKEPATNNACYSNIVSANRLYISTNGNWPVVDSN